MTVPDIYTKSAYGKNLSFQRNYAGAPAGPLIIEVECRDVIVKQEDAEKLRDLLIDIVGPKPEPKPYSAREKAKSLEVGTRFRSPTGIPRPHYIKLTEDRYWSFQTDDVYPFTTMFDDFEFEVEGIDY